jgi:hypothetical protein
LSEAIQEYDRILFDNYVYDIVTGGILRKKSYLTGRTELYKVFVEKRREYNEDTVTISARVT